MEEQNGIERAVHVPDSTFAAAAIATGVLVLNKHKSTTDISFEDRELNEEKTVTFDEMTSRRFKRTLDTQLRPLPWMYIPMLRSK
jgi:hypothetical protein